MRFLLQTLYGVLNFIIHLSDGDKKTKLPYKLLKPIDRVVLADKVSGLHVAFSIVITVRWNCKYHWEQKIHAVHATGNYWSDTGLVSVVVCGIRS